MNWKLFLSSKVSISNHVFQVAVKFSHYVAECGLNMYLFKPALGNRKWFSIGWFLISVDCLEVAVEDLP